MAPARSSRFVWLLLTLATFTSPGVAESEIKVIEFEVTSIDPEAYRVGEATTITYRALLLNKGPDPVEPSDADVSIVLVVLRLGLDGGQTVGNGTVEIPTNWAAGEGFRVRPSRILATLSRQACRAGNDTPSGDAGTGEGEDAHRLCAGVTLQSDPSQVGNFKAENAQCVDFGEIEKGGAGVIDCSSAFIVPLYAIVLLVVFSVLLFMGILYLCKKIVCRTHPKNDVPIEEAAEEPVVEHSRPRFLSFSHIYEDVAKMIRHPHSRTVTREAGYHTSMSGNENANFQPDIERHDQIVAVPDSTNSSPVVARSRLDSKRPSCPNNYALEDTSVMIEQQPGARRHDGRTVILIHGVPRLATTDTLEALDEVGNVVGLADGRSSPETAVGPDAAVRPREADTTAVAVSLEPVPLNVEHEIEGLRVPIKYDRSFSIGMPLREAPGIPDVDYDVDPYATSIPVVTLTVSSPEPTAEERVPEPGLSPSPGPAAAGPSPSPGPADAGPGPDFPVQIHPEGSDPDPADMGSDSSTAPSPVPPRSSVRRVSAAERTPRDCRAYGEDELMNDRESTAPSRPPVPLKSRRISKSNSSSRKNEDADEDVTDSCTAIIRPPVPVKPSSPRKVDSLILRENSGDRTQDLSSGSTSSLRAGLPPKPRLPSKSDSLRSGDRVQDLSTASTSSARSQPPILSKRPSQHDSFSQRSGDGAQDFSTSSTSSARSQPRTKQSTPSRSDSWNEKIDDGVQDLSGSSTSSGRRQQPLSIFSGKPIDIDSVSHTPVTTPRTLTPTPQVNADLINVAFRQASQNNKDKQSWSGMSTETDDTDPDVDPNPLAMRFMQNVIGNYLALMELMSGTDYEVAVQREEKKLKRHKPSSSCSDIIRRKSFSAQLIKEQRRRTVHSVEYVNTWNRSWEIKPENLEIDRSKILGEGQFGLVYKATATHTKNHRGSVLVAVKELKDGSNAEDMDEFLKELAIHTIMEPHPHVVELIGCCIRDGPVSIVTEYLSGGSLLTYLRSRPARDTGLDLVRHYVAKFGLHIARGMAHVSRMEIVHRDLAARNILISRDEVCKVSDFGFARDIRNIDYYTKAPDKAPIRWYAPESIMDNLFNCKSDVWSFGVLLYEIATLGRMPPYKGKSNEEVRVYVSCGKHPTKPPHCDYELSDIMDLCWRKEADDRPSFSELVKMFEDIQHRYLDPHKLAEEFVMNLEDDVSPL